MTTKDLARRPNRLAEPVAARPRVVPICDTNLSRAARDMRGLGLPDDLDAGALLDLAAAFGSYVAVRKREILYRATTPFTALYAIRLGTFKTVVLCENGREQITGYHMGGDLLGLDGIGDEHHACEAIALEDSEVSALPFARLDELARREPFLRRNLFRIFSRNLRRGQQMMVVLGSMSAEERVAAFLLDLAQRFRHGGYSASEFMLRMTREEIANFLGLKLETVSRIFSRLHGEGLIQVQGRAVKLLDAAALRHMAAPPG